ncbi:class I SAM-dependent methyltransferase [candidate division KSB1 bacterium]|nr:class I SAM-dependent methyltransferase [candidate division KSB1 bacterium]
MSLNIARKRQIVPPYTKLASGYDYLMRHVNYKQWAEYVYHLIRMSDEAIGTILDVSCGTGSLLLELAKKKYVLSGFDYSNDMVKIARQKLHSKALPFPVWVGDMRAFALQRPQDAIVCLYDSINYLMEIENWKAFYIACHDNLRSGGLLIFDVCTEWNSIKHFQNYTDKDRTSNFKYVRRSYYNLHDRIHHNDFKIKIRDDNQVYFEYHKQKIYNIDEILASLPDDKFDIIGAYHEFTTMPARNASERVHFLLKKR